MDTPDQMVTLVVDQGRYAVDLAAVEQVLPMSAISPVPGAPHVVLGAINLHGSVVPVVDIRRRLGLGPFAYGIAAHLLIVRTRRRRLALAADQVFGVARIDQGSVTPTATVLPGLGPVKGIAPLADGILFIYDIEAFLTSAEEGDLDRAVGGTER